MGLVGWLVGWLVWFGLVWFGWLAEEIVKVKQTKLSFYIFVCGFPLSYLY
jgi:hypothetical protein